MKKFLPFLFLALASICKADSTTNRLGLTLPTVGSPTWGQKINGNFQIIDATVAALGARNTIFSSTTYKGYVEFDSTVNWKNLQFGVGQCLGINSSSNTILVTCGGGGSSTLDIHVNGAQISSPTASISFNSAFIGSQSPTGTANISLNSSSVTLQGRFVAGSNITLTPGSGVTTISATGAGTPGGNTPDVQVNHGGSFYADDNFQYDSSVSSVTISGNAGIGTTLEINKNGFFSAPILNMYNTGSPNGGVFIYENGNLGASVSEQGSDFALSASTRTSGSFGAFPRIALDRTSQKITFKNIAGTPYVSFDPVANSSFTIPVVLATLPSASSLATDSTGKIIAGSGGNGGSSIYQATSTAGFPFGASFSTITVNQTNLGNVNAVTIISTGTGQGINVQVQGLPSNGYQNQIGGVTISNPDPNVSKALLVLTDSSTDATNGDGLLELWENNAAHNSYLMWIHGDSVRNSDEPIRFDGPTFGIDEVNTSTDQAHGKGKWKVISEAYQGVDLQIASSRAYDNTTFEHLLSVHPLTMTDRPAGMYLDHQNLTNDSGILPSADTSAIGWFGLNDSFVGLTGPLNPIASWTFALPNTANNLGQVLYQSDNGRGGNNNARSWAFTSGGSTGQVLTYQSGSAPIWTTVSSGGSSIYPATSTASFPFGLSASTGVFTSTLNVNRVDWFTNESARIDRLNSNSLRLTASNQINTDFTTSSSFVSGADNIVYGRTTSQYVTQDYNAQDGFAVHTTPVQQSLEPWASYSASVNGDGLGLNQVYFGARAKLGEDAFFAIAAGTNTSCGASCFENQPSTPVFVVNTRVGSINYGNVGIGISTPMATLSVGGHIETSLKNSAGTISPPSVTACGGGSPTTTSISTDENGTLTTGTGVFSSCTMTFTKPFNNPPQCFIEDQSSALSITPKVPTTTTTMIITGITFTAGDVYSYLCIGNH